MMPVTLENGLRAYCRVLQAPAAERPLPTSAAAGGRLLSKPISQLMRQVGSNRLVHPSQPTCWHVLRLPDQDLLSMDDCARHPASLAQVEEEAFARALDVSAREQRTGNSGVAAGARLHLLT